MVLGPPADMKEAPEYVGLVRIGLMALGAALDVRVLDLSDQASIQAALQAQGTKALSARLRSAIAGASAVPRDRRLFLATAAAVAGVMELGAELP